MKVLNSITDAINQRSILMKTGEFFRQFSYERKENEKEITQKDSKNNVAEECEPNGIKLKWQKQRKKKKIRHELFRMRFQFLIVVLVLYLFGFKTIFVSF